MDQFNIQLAEIPIEICVRYPYTRRMCADYLTAAAAQLRVEITDEDIRNERIKSVREALYEGLQPVNFSDGYLESIAVYRKIATALPERHAAVFHGAVIAVDGVAYAFTAASGTGKTTHMNLWLSHFGSRALVVNGDKPILKNSDGQFYACGTPWSGKEKLNTNIMLPLKAICILERDSTNHIEPITLHDALPMLLQQIYRPDDTQAMRATFSFLRELGASVKLYRLGCNMEQEAAIVAYQGMNV